MELTESSKTMNILLWVIQAVLFLWNISGGIYMMNHHEQLANSLALKTLPDTAWLFIGALQVLFALGLVLPGLLRVLPKFVPASAVGLAAISLSGILLFTSYTGTGILWGVIPAIISVFVAYGRCEWCQT